MIKISYFRHPKAIAYCGLRIANWGWMYIVNLPTAYSADSESSLRYDCQLLSVLGL